MYVYILVRIILGEKPRKTEGPRAYARYMGSTYLHQNLKVFICPVMVSTN